MFEEYGAAGTRTLSVGDVDSVAAVVLAGVAYVISGCCVGSPCLSYFGDNVSFNFASKRCIRLAVVVMLTPQVCVGRNCF